MQQFSDTASTILQNGIGYRNDYLYSGDDYEISDIIEYETEELGNVDIFDYTNSHSVNNVLSYIAKKWHQSLPFGQPIYGYWFTTKENVYDLYTTTGIDEPITQFILPNKYLILSDLGPDGILIASPTPKSELEQKIITD